MLVVRQPLSLVILICLLSYSADSYAASRMTQTPVETKTDHKLPSIPYIHFDGNLRSYFFERNYTKAGLPNQQAFSLGGKFNLLTDQFLQGFRVGGTLYTAQPLGLNPKNLAQVDPTLPGSPVTVLGQAFLHYENPYLFTRLGDQLITTPWLNEADSRMIPATFQGFFVKWTPVSHLQLMALRMVRFKSWISSRFNQTNLYTPSNRAFAINALANKTVVGALGLGAEYNLNTLNVRAWDYQFYDYAQLLYGDIKYTVETDVPVKPILGAQLAREWNNGNAVLCNILGGTDSTAYGVLIGADIVDGRVTVGYDNIRKHAGSYGNGDIVSPYTITYNSDPLYTTSMIAGLIEKAAGSALKLTATYPFLAKKLLISASYARYLTAPFIPNTSEEDVDITYKPKETIKNLSLRYRVGLSTGNPNFGRFVYNRFMLQYDF